MHSLLLRFRVSQRLTAAFAVLILITGAVTLSGLWALNENADRLHEIVGQNMAKINLSTQMLDANGQLLTSMQGLVLETEVTRFPAYLERISNNQKQYDQAAAALLRLPTSATGTPIIERIRAARELAQPLSNTVIELGQTQRLPEAMRAYEGAEQAALTWQAAIRDYIALQQADAAAAHARALAQTALGHRLLVVGGLLALLVSVLLAWAITRSLVIPLRAATAVADRIAAGEVGGVITVVGRDETADLQRSMASMQSRLSGLMTAQLALAEQQLQGNISYRTPDSGFPGAYGELVRSSNAMAENNASVIAQVLSTAGRYSVGDLDVRMPVLPGEQATITDAMDAMRGNLLAISSDIRQLAEAAARGDFSQRGDSAAFDFVFRDIVVNLNALFDACDSSLDGISTLLAGIAGGDLTLQAQGRHEGVFARICDSANTTSGNLRRIIAGIQSSARIISSSSAEIANGNSDLSRRTEQQAANLEETAASMEELTSTVRQNAEHTRQASSLAEAAERSASEGGTAAAEAVATMERIDTSSKRVSDIISVIDNIAFQTNILALNAAVEAARAGEQGRGFAVVASEVRILAQRCAGAAKDVKTLIDGSAEEIRSGVAIVRGTGTVMSGLVGAIQQLRQSVAEIAAASQEQSSGIEQVNQSVVQMDETTQQNAALVEEATAASRALQEQAELLDDAVAVFKVAA